MLGARPDITPVPLNVDGRDFANDLVLPGQHAPHVPLDHDRRRNAALVLVTHPPRAVPKLHEQNLAKSERKQGAQKNNERAIIARFFPNTTLCLSVQ